MLREILYYAVLFFSILVSIVSVFRKRRDEKNDEDGTKTTSGIIKGTMSAILDNIPKYIVAAEKLYNGLVGECGKKTGSQKLEYVLDKLKLDCLTNNLPFDGEFLTSKINELIDLTKQVN